MKPNKCDFCTLLTMLYFCTENERNLFSIENRPVAFYTECLLNTIYRRFTIHFQSSVVLLNWDRKLTVLKVWLLFIVFSIVCRTSFGELRRGRNPLAPSHPLDPELQKKAWPKATYRNVVAVRSVPVSSIRSLSAVCHFGLGFGFLSDSIAHCPCFVKWRHITVCQECIWMASSIWIQPAHPVTIGMAFQLDVMAVKS